MSFQEKIEFYTDEEEDTRKISGLGSVPIGEINRNAVFMDLLPELDGRKKEILTYFVNAFPDGLCMQCIENKCKKSKYTFSGRITELANLKNKTGHGFCNPPLIEPVGFCLHPSVGGKVRRFVKYRVITR